MAGPGPERKALPAWLRAALQRPMATAAEESAETAEAAHCHNTPQDRVSLEPPLGDYTV